MYNTSDHYGLVAILLHWLMAIVIFGLFGLGLYLVELGYYDPLGNILPFIHISVGMLLVPVLIFGIIWKLIYPRPASLAGTTALERALAKLVHHLLTLLIAAILISGYLITTAKGVGASIFDIISVPSTITSIPEQEYYAGLMHLYLAYGLIALVVLHGLAALKHHFINRDNTLRRMLGMSQNKP
jgi:cytochrome b561